MRSASNRTIKSHVVSLWPHHKITCSLHLFKKLFFSELIKNCKFWGNLWRSHTSSQILAKIYCSFSNARLISCHWPFNLLLKNQQNCNSLNKLRITIIQNILMTYIVTNCTPVHMHSCTVYCTYNVQCIAPCACKAYCNIKF